jgi:2-aminomuconate deaminase
VSDSSSGVVAGAATPRGRFPHLRRAGDLVYVSGTSARRADDSIDGRDIATQTRAVITNIRTILASTGAELRDLVAVTTYLVTMDDFERYNEVWAEFFDETGPTRTTVAVRQLPHPDLLIEMQAVAHIAQEVSR